MWILGLKGPLSSLPKVDVMERFKCIIILFFSFLLKLSLSVFRQMILMKLILKTSSNLRLGSTFELF